VARINPFSVLSNVPVRELSPQRIVPYLAGTPVPDGIPFLSETSMYFDGVDDNISTTGSWPELSSSGSGYSVSWWFKSATYPPVPSRTFFQLSDTAGKYRLQMYIWTATPGGLVVNEGNADTVSFLYGQWASNKSWVIDTLWHHYTITSPGDGSPDGVKIYIDGVLIGTRTGKPLGSDLGAVKLWVGSYASFGGPLVGGIDEFAIFGAELSPAQVATLSGGPTDLSLHADIQHYYRMGDSIGDAATLIRDQVAGLDLDLVYGTPVIDADVP